MPIRESSLEKGLWGLLFHKIVEFFDFFPIFAAADPVIASFGGPRKEQQGDPYNGIDRALGNWIAAEDAVFGVFPGAFKKRGDLVACGKKIDPRLTASMEVDQKIALAFIVEKASVFWSELCCVTDIIPIDPEGVGEEKADFFFLVGPVFKGDLFQIEVFMKIDTVVPTDPKIVCGPGQFNVGDE